MFGILSKSGEKRVVIPTSVDIEVDAINKGKPHDALYTAGLNYIHNLEGRYDVGLYVNAFITKLCLSYGFCFATPLYKGPTNLFLQDPCEDRLVVDVRRCKEHYCVSAQCRLILKDKLCGCRRSQRPQRTQKYDREK